MSSQPLNLKYVLWLIGLLAMLPGTAQAIACTAIFSNAVGTTSGELELNNSVSLTNTGAGVLATDDLDVNNGNNKCDGSACTASGSYAPTVALPSNSSTTDFNPSGAASFSPGDYYYDDFRLDGNDVVTLTGSGTVRIHVRDDMVIRNNATINAGGSANQLIFLVGDDVELRNDAVIAGFIYAVENVDFYQDAALTGAIVGETADLRNNSVVNYVAPSTIDTNGWCTVSTPPSGPSADFGLDDQGLNGTAGELTDDQGNYNNAFALGTGSGVASTTIARICRALDIPENLTEADKWGADTGIDIDDDLGNSGAITFWYRGDTAWNSGVQRMLMDASEAGTSANKFFHVSVTADGRVRLYIEDSGETDLMTETPQQSVSANTWKHIGVSWDLPNDTYRIYIDGSLVTTGTTNSNGVVGETQTLYIGDNRSNYHFGGSNNSAHGIIDEVRVYDSAVPAATVLADYNRTGSCPGQNTPYAEFRLEEGAGIWNGTAGEVVDTQGASTTALASGTGSGVDTTANGKICRGGVIPNNTTEAAKYYVDTGVDLDSELGSAGSFTFWYRSNNAWVGGGDRQLADASEDNQSNAKYFYLTLLNNGQLYLRLEDSSDGDHEATAPAQSVAAGTWKHIGVVWDLPNDSYQIYIDGSLVATGTTGSTGTIGTLETLVFGDNRGDYHPGGTDRSANGTIDEIRLYDQALTAAEVLADYNYTRTCSGGSVDPDGFNCVVTGGNALTGNLYLQMAGNAFTFEVVALKDSDGNGTMDAVETTYASGADRDVTVELVDASGALACAARPALSPAVSQTLTFTAADLGRKAAAAMTVNRAYATVGCRVTDTTPDPDVVACSTDTFTVRPTALTLSAPTLNNGGSAGAPNAAAGSTFSLSVVGGAGYNGTPKVDATKITPHAGAVATGTLSGAFGAANPATGTATGSSFAYSEVGNFRFAAEGLYDDTFASGDIANGDCTNDFSNTAVGGRFGCKFGNTAATAWIGRFHPADFLVAVQNNGALANACVAGSFSYQGEEISMSVDPVLRVTARNSGGGTTQNYTGSYEKLSTTDFTFAAVTGDGTQNGVDGTTPVTASWSTAGIRVLDDNGDGTLDLNLTASGFTWGRVANDLVAPFTTDLDLDLTAVTDADGVAATGLPVTASPTGVSMRYGRLAMTNAHGSELQHLAMPMQVEYYLGVGTGFVVHTADTCTTVGALSFTDLDAGDGLATSETCVWDDDNDSGLGCAGSAPAGKEYEPTPLAGGLNLHLMAPGSGNTGAIQVGADAPNHLEFNWTGAGDSDPNARAVFGIFNRPSSIIYRREVR